MRQIRAVVVAVATTLAIVLTIALTPNAANAATWTSLSGWVNTNGTWTVGEIVRYFAGGSKSIHFYATSLPGCCLDIATHESTYGTWWGEVDNIQSAKLGIEYELNTGSIKRQTYSPTGATQSWCCYTLSGYFRIWHRNTVVGGDNSWTGQLAYNYPS